MKPKTRVAILYENGLGRNDGAPLYFKHCLDKAVETGVISEAMHLIPDGNYKDFGKFDLSIWPDFGEDALVDILPYKPVLPEGPLAYFASDTHLGPDYRFSMAEKADYAFFAQKRAIEEYKPSKKNKSVTWLPHAFEPECYRPGVWTGKEWIDGVPNKEYDICFVGHMQDVENYNGFTRMDFLDRMFKEFPSFYFGTRSPIDKAHNLFDDASSKFNKSKVCLNISIKDDVNMRVFEVSGSGAFLLTNWLPDLEELGYIDGVTCATYKTLDEAVEKTKYYLEHEEEREKIAKAGYELAIAKHKWSDRLDVILKTAGIL